MAGFLRKKNKEDVVVRPVPSAPIPLGSSNPPPLFARFATSTKTIPTSPPRIVSSPMMLSGDVRKEVSSRQAGGDVAKRRTTQNQGLHKTLPHIQSVPSEQPRFVPPPTFHAPIVDKPLPRPSSVDPSGSTPTQSSFKQQSSRGPPSAFQNQPRTSGDDVGNKESKQFYRSPSAKSFYSGQTEGLIWNDSSTNVAASRRNSTVSSNSNLPPIANRKMYQNPPTASFGRQIVPAQTTQTRSVANQDLQPANVIGAAAMGVDERQGTPVLDRGFDLPPEFALFQEFISEDVPASNKFATPSIYTMGVASSHPIPHDFYPSSPKSIQPIKGKPRIFAAQEDLLEGKFAAMEDQPPLQPVLKNRPSQSSMYHPHPQRQPSAQPGKPRIFAAMEDQPVLRNLPSQSTLYQPPSAPRFSAAEDQPVLRNLSSQSTLYQPPSAPHFSAVEDQPVLRNLSSQSTLYQPDAKARFSAMEDQPIQPILRNRPSQSTLYQPPPVPDGKPLFSAQEVQPILRNRPSQSTLYQPQYQPSVPDLNTSTNGVEVISSLPPPVPSTPKLPIHEQLPPTPPSRSSRNLPQNPARTRKLSKVRTLSDAGSFLHEQNGSNVTIPTPDSHHRGASTRTFTKSRPTTPASSHKPLPVPLEPLDQVTKSNAVIPLDDDPFARVEGVTLLKPSKEIDKDKESNGSGKKHRKKKSSKGPSISSQSSLEGEEEGKSVSEKASAVALPPTPISPEEHRMTKKKKKKQREDDSQTEETPAPLPPMVDAEDGEDTLAAEDEEEDEPEPIPSMTMAEFISDPQLLSSLLTFLSFYDWCLLASLSKEIRILLVQTSVLRETVLERFLRTVGYSRWIWDDPDPLSLSLQDLTDYMRGVSTPTHEYARVGGMYVHSLSVHPNHRDPMLLETVQILTASTCAYTRVVLRLRAQAEKEVMFAQQSRAFTTLKPYFNSPSSARGGTNSRVSSRAPSPTTSSYSHSRSHSYNGTTPISNGGHMHQQQQQQQPSQNGLTFRSPLFRLRRAPLLRVFVPSPEGDWLSDKSVLACEAECKRAGVLHLMRLGDVVWDVAVGDEGNVGRLVWDGSYLIDLDYTYSSIGDLPKYMPTLAFPPSYFHRVIRTGPIVSNPIVHIDISPWGEEIAMNLQLLQDRVRTETPQGAYHNVVRWVHRSSFVIRPPRGPGSNNTRGNGSVSGRSSSSSGSPRIPIPDTDKLFVDPGWYGTIVVETEGTNEAVLDLQERCGPGVFPPRSRGLNHLQMNKVNQIENKKVFRILREKSRPSEIWIKTVGIKERML